MAGGMRPLVNEHSYKENNRFYRKKKLTLSLAIFNNYLVGGFIPFQNISQEG